MFIVGFINWQRREGVNGGLAVFHRGDGGLDQLLVPLNSGVPDYGRRIAEVAQNLSAIEKRPVDEVLSDLLLPDADVRRVQDAVGG